MAYVGVHHRLHTREEFMPQGGNMRNVHIDYPSADLSYQRASLIARDTACDNQMADPTIIAWHRSSSQDVSPSFAGGNPDNWWAKYGEGNGGGLEVSVGDEYQFMLMDTRAYERLGSFPLRNLKDEAGIEYLCLIPMLDDTGRPRRDACSPLDDWLADQF